MAIAPKIYFNSRKTWHDWLVRNHDKAKNLWLVHDKTSQGGKLTYDEIVEEALCFGWIDGTLRRIDEKQAMIYLTQRQPKSVWAQSNKERVEKLTKSGLMSSSGLAVVNRAKEDGSWSAFDNVEHLVIPQELKVAFSKNSTAENNFEKFSISLRKQILYYIYSAKQEETRKKRVERILTYLKVGKNPFTYNL